MQVFRKVIIQCCSSKLKAERCLFKHENEHPNPLEKLNISYFADLKGSLKTIEGSLAIRTVPLEEYRNLL